MSDWTHYLATRHNAPGTVTVTRLVQYFSTASPKRHYWMWEVKELVQCYMRFRAGEAGDHDSGYFFLEDDSTGDLQNDSHVIVAESGLSGQFSSTPATNCYASSGTYPGLDINPQPSTLDILPSDDIPNQDTLRPYPGLLTPFLIDNGDHADDVKLFVWFAGGILTGTCSLKFYCPWAFDSANMYKVLSTVIYDFFNAEDDSTEAWDEPEGDDSAAFNKAEWENCDELDWDSGGVAARYLVVRKEGESLLELMKRIVRHFPYFWLSFDMQGKLSLTSTLSPLISVIVSNQSGIMGDIEYRYDPIYHCNIGLIRYFQSSIVQGGATSNTTSPNHTSWAVSSQWEGFPSGGHAGTWAVECLGANPLLNTLYHPDQYVWIKGKRVDLTTQFREHRSDNPKQESLLGGEVQVLHLPFANDNDNKGVRAIQREIESYNQIDPRVVYKIKQDFEGLDFDVGHRVYAQYLKGDGEASVTTYCTAKKIDFNNMTVESELLEVPSAPSP